MINWSLSDFSQKYTGPQWKPGNKCINHYCRNYLLEWLNTYWTLNKSSNWYENDNNNEIISMHHSDHIDNKHLVKTKI